MHLSPLVALLAWIPLCIYLFHRYPVRIAILANFFAGWALLPGARYVASTAEFPYWFLGVCLPTNYLITKASITGLAALLGILLFHFRDLRGFRLSLWDLPMAIWCFVPILSSAVNPATFHEGLLGVPYQLLSWGVPYLLGRIYFTDRDSLLLAARACVIAGLVYVPICLIEFFAGPQFYAHLYGYQPYRWIGAGRTLGFRPIGFLEDGNQLGIWMAGSALVAIALWIRNPLGRLLGLSQKWIAITLCIFTLLCQSWGSILLLLASLPIILFRRRHFLRVCVAVLVLGIVFFAALRLSNVVSLRALTQQNPEARAIARSLRKIGKGSFGWRLGEDESHVNLALRKPVLGWGQWNWWQSTDVRPWGLWLLAFGMYGIVGLLALELLQLLPVVHAIWFSPPSASREDSDLRIALAALILITAVDNLLNGRMILPFLLIIGGLTARQAGLRIQAAASAIKMRA